MAATVTRDRRLAARTTHGLDVDELRRLRTDLLEEIASAVRGRADPEHLAQVVTVLDAVDRRLERLDD